jgi:hypothetical protein
MRGYMSGQQFYVTGLDCSGFHNGFFVPAGGFCTLLPAILMVRYRLTSHSWYIYSIERQPGIFMCKFILALLALVIAAENTVNAQSAADTVQVVVVTKNDGSVYTGRLLSSDPREILLDTETIGQLFIPKHEIRSIEPFTGKTQAYSKELFSTRYFISSNGLPVEKGDSYVQWTLFGPDMQFGIADNLGVGVITSWIAIPVIASIKYSVQLKGDFSYAVGALAGGNVWAPATFYAALPFASITKGDRNANLTVSAGYGIVGVDGGDREQQFLFSLGGMRKVTKSGTLVFDSFITPTDGTTYMVLIPGYRIQTKENSAFQIGFPGLIEAGESQPAAFPMVSWFRKF